MRPASRLTTKSSGQRWRECSICEMFFQYHGDGSCNPIADANPSLQLLIEATRFGAKVRLLLDSYFDETEALRSNQATVEYLAAVAGAEGLDIVRAVGNPTGGGIHAKWLLARVDGVT